MEKKSRPWLLPCILLVFIGAGIIFYSASIRSSKKDVTLIVKAPTLAMMSVADPEMEDAEKFLKMAGEAFAASYEKANVHIQLEIFSYKDEIKAITDTFGTSDAPDVLYEGYFNMSSYIHTGRVVPLDDIISREMREDIDDVLWEMSMAGGKTYMMPYLSLQNIMVYNKELFEKAGLTEYAKAGKEIQNWTMDEWTSILDTLAENLPEGVYPMMMYAGDNQGDTHIMSCLRAFGSPIFAEDGTFDLESEEGISGLKWIQDGVDRNWYPPNPENIVISDNVELFAANQLAICMTNNYNLDVTVSIEDVGFVNFPGNVATSFVTGFEVFDNGDDLKLQAAKDFVKYIYETDEWLDLSAGALPASRRVAEKYEDQIPMMREFLNNSSHVVDFMKNSPNWQGKEDSVRSVFWPHIHDLLAKTVTPEECAKAIDADCNAAIRVESHLHE